MDIELVIKMPEELLRYFDSFYLMNGNENKNIDILVEVIKKGTPLPKGHGRLIDASNIMTVTDYDGENEKTYIPYDEIENAPTIIEADEGVNEE